MRQALAAATDVAAAGALAFVAFRGGYQLVPCANKGACSLLTPAVVVIIAAVEVAYFGIAQLLAGASPGQWLFRVKRRF
ncbi:MAG TPA: hypothetical protein VKX16_02475 [Chloroflexota bacterium]|nr:hypothetical protein [Chloroflexota bacterium]